ncbi:uncharacterized protein N7479_004767 [Penicillium vulpinum]|uniref:uncharacterized protein n=1 Tax=Penicillium vulpinum TaxID=29845 RepID=UPI0025467AE6|nr:uncharacterized protein N7479_004767 [Penicillium vulpinum]KAJ5964891.1 hypothetical protein N7479_004767 [Penicillium vulpinum]
MLRSNHRIRLSTPSLTVAGSGFRTIGRLGNDALRSFASILRFDHPLQSFTSIDHPLRSSTPSLTVAGFGFRTIGRLVSIRFDHQLQSSLSITHFDCSSQISISTTHFDYPLQSPTPSLIVAGSGFRKIGRQGNDALRSFASIIPSNLSP